MSGTDGRRPEAAGHSIYQASGVDASEADRGLKRMLPHILGTWGPDVALRLGHFANVVDVGGIGIAISTDGVGSKALVAQMVGKYDTIGIDCIAMNVNDLVCVGARPVSMVDYIAVERPAPELLEALAVGLADGARAANISLVGGEIAQLPDIITGARPGMGFDLVGTAIGHVPLDKMLTGEDVTDGDIVIGLESSGVHSNGLSLARRAFFERGLFGVEHEFAELELALGLELLRPSEIYVGDALDLMGGLGSLNAMAHITGDGLLNLVRVGKDVGYVIDALPPAPPIFALIQTHGEVAAAEMYSVFNMGIGFCAVVGPEDEDQAMAILKARGRRAHVIGRVVADHPDQVVIPERGLIGEGKTFRTM